MSHDEDALVRAERRVIENRKRIADFEDRIKRLKDKGEPTNLAQDILNQLKRSQDLFEEHERTLR